MRSTQPVVGRAQTPEAKEAIMERLLHAWKQQPALRLSQLVYVATDGKDIFYWEDEEFTQVIEAYIRRSKV